MKTIEIIFRPTQLLDPRKTGSTLEIGQELKGTMQLSNSCVSWEDINEQGWCFWIGDTAELVEIISKGENADLYRLFLELKENHDYWGLCDEIEMKDFCNRNNIVLSKKEVEDYVLKLIQNGTLSREDYEEYLKGKYFYQNLYEKYKDLQDEHYIHITFEKEFTNYKKYNEVSKLLVENNPQNFSID